MSVITIVGAGMMGSAMSFPARDNGHEVRLVGIHNRETIESVKANGWHPTLKRTLPEGVKCYHIEDLQTALDGADLVIGGVSSFGVDWFEQTVLPLLPDNFPVLSITKGLEKTPEGNLVPFPVAMTRRAEAQGRKMCLNAVGGPVTSYELAERQQTCICFCGPDIKVLRWLKSLLETDYYHISLTTDIVGLECAVAMKNAYALGVSLAVGKNKIEFGEEGVLHYNPQAALFEQGTTEATRLMQMLGADMRNLMFFTGDLYVTIFGGRTRLIGTLLGQGYPYTEAREMLAGITLESVAITTRVAEAIRQQEKLGKASTKDFPLLMLIDDMISRGGKADIPWELFPQEII
ncbi:MAG: glycerol-3-phosphate dehydrogenase [Eubacteriales bacterium]|nr:glycerol-3-phosphate dehydrogenase [Eubacteriales bacterium]